MTDTTKMVFENYEVRKTKKQKEEFRSFVKNVAYDEGYSYNIEKGSYGAQNIVIGSPKNAKVIYTAHYDTPAGVPFPNLITPKSLPLYILYQLLICILLYTVPVIMILVLPELAIAKTDSAFLYTLSILSGYVVLFLSCYLLVAGPANPHNANDNTSGVTVLLDLMQAMPEEDRKNAAFIFFDLEEMGCIGSQSYRKKHNKEMKTKPIINFDCVSDGKTILFALNKKAAPLAEKLAEAYPSNDKITSDIATKGVFYPSDQRSFEIGVGVAALKTSKKGILYTDKIHTKNDTVYDEENIAYLTEGSIKLTKII